MSYNQSPNKSVINDIMNKLTKVKHMPFAFLVGDLPVYVLVTLLKAENSVKYHNNYCTLSWSIPYTVLNDEYHLQTLKWK